MFLEDHVYLDESFRKSIWPILIIAQLFGLMPVIGISRQSINDLKFNWKSKRTIYGFIVVMFSTCYSIFNAYQTLTEKMNFDSFGMSNNKTNINTSDSVNNHSSELFLSAFMLFYAINSFGCISFFVLAMKWPDLMQYWEIAEYDLNSLKTFKQKYCRMLRIRYVAFTILFFAFGIIFSNQINQSFSNKSFYNLFCFPFQLKIH